MRGKAANALRRTLIAGAFLFAAGTILLSMPVVAALLVEPLQIFPPLSPSALAADASGAKAIVILSAGRRNYGPEIGGVTVDALSLERVRYGAYLARKTGLPVLVSGGIAGGKPSLARLLADVLSNDYGVQARWLEERSKTTAENAIDSAALLKRDGITHIILVTHAWHMRRAEAAFTANGMVVTPAPTVFYEIGVNHTLSKLMPMMTALRMSNFAIHEIVGIAWYRVRYGY